MEHNEMSINDSKIEFIEDDRLTDLAGGSEYETVLASEMHSKKLKTIKNCFQRILKRYCFYGEVKYRPNLMER
jgi:hypothetical protein